jgi:hypothetical protein
LSTKAALTKIHLSRRLLGFDMAPCLLASLHLSIGSSGIADRSNAGRLPTADRPDSYFVTS